MVFTGPATFQAPGPKTIPGTRGYGTARWISPVLVCTKPGHHVYFEPAKTPLETDTIFFVIPVSMEIKTPGWSGGFNFGAACLDGHIDECPRPLVVVKLQAVIAIAVCHVENLNELLAFVDKQA